MHKRRLGSLADPRMGNFLFFLCWAVYFSAYLGRLRIEKAQQLLACGEKINWVAQLVGCGNNPQYFSQMFKKYTGIPPKIWQSQNGA